MRILLQRTGSLGDVLFTTPVLTALRKRCPDAMIGMVTDWGVATARHPGVNWQAQRLEGDWDHFINLDMAHETRRSMHQVDAFLEAAELTDMPDEDKSVVFPHENFGRVPGRVVMHANVSWPNRTHPKEMWEEIANGLVKLGYEVVLTGTGADHGFAGPGIRDMRDRLRLHEQASLMESADCVVTGSSMIGVLVGCTETPCVSLYTMTKAEHCMPYRHGEIGWNYTGIGTPLSCYGCSERAGPVTYLDCERGDLACIGSVPAEQIIAATRHAIAHDLRR